jgi:hypothetical protein
MIYEFIELLHLNILVFHLINEFSDSYKTCSYFLFVYHFIFDFELNQRSGFVAKTRNRVSNNRYFILNLKKIKEKFRLKT